MSLHGKILHAKTNISFLVGKKCQFVSAWMFTMAKAPKTPKGEVAEGRQQSPAQGTMVISCPAPCGKRKQSCHPLGLDELQDFDSLLKSQCIWNDNLVTNILSWENQTNIWPRLMERMLNLNLVKTLKSPLGFLSLILSYTTMVSFSFLKAITSKMQWQSLH